MRRNKGGESDVARQVLIQAQMMTALLETDMQLSAYT